jgi:hypothetical protein
MISNNNNHSFCVDAKQLQIQKVNDIKWMMCQNCSLIYSISVNEEKNHYKYEQFDKLGETPPATISEFKSIIKILKRYTKTENLTLFDFGCGDGSFLKIAENDFKDVVGFEPNNFLRHRSLKKKIKIIDKKIFETKNLTYDILFTRNTFPFVLNFSESLSKLIVSLSPDGYFIWRDKFWDYFPKKYSDVEFSNTFSSLPIKSTIKHYLKINGIKLLISRFYFDDSFLIIGKKTNATKYKSSNKTFFLKKKFINSTFFCSIISILRSLLNQFYVSLRSIKNFIQ